MLKIGIVGMESELIKTHIDNIRQISNCVLAGFVCTHDAEAQAIITTYPITRFMLLEDLLSEVDILDIVMPPFGAYEVAMQALRKGRHIFSEQPVTQNVEELKILVKFIKEAQIKCQIGGGMGRWNTAYSNAIHLFNHIRQIDIQHYFISNSIHHKQVDVLFNNILDNVDIVLSAIKSPIKNIRANGLSIFGNQIDKIDVLLAFQNDSIANITVNNIFFIEKHTAVFFQNGTYINVDFLASQYEVYNLGNNDVLNIMDKEGIIKTEQKMQNGTIIRYASNPTSNRVLYNALVSFCSFVEGTSPIKINELDALNILEITNEILKQIHQL